MVIAVFPDTSFAHPNREGAIPSAVHRTGVLRSRCRRLSRSQIRIAATVKSDTEAGKVDFAECQPDYWHQKIPVLTGR